MCGKGFSITTLLVVKSTIAKISSLCSPYKKLELFSRFKSTLKRAGEIQAAGLVLQYRHLVTQDGI